MTQMRRIRDDAVKSRTGTCSHGNGSLNLVARCEACLLLWRCSSHDYEALAQSRFLDLSSNAKQIFSDTGIIVHFEKPELVVQTIREAWEQSK